jgi:hypothetical protein
MDLKDLQELERASRRSSQGQIWRPCRNSDTCGILHAAIFVRMHYVRALRGLTACPAFRAVGVGVTGKKPLARIEKPMQAKSKCCVGSLQ